MEQAIPPGTNVLWCDTFQLAWNELCGLAGGPVEIQGGSPLAGLLNKRAATKEDLDAESYVAMAGLARDGILEKIRAALEEKFKGRASPKLLDSAPGGGWIAYAYLFKHLPFEWQFDRFRGLLNFGGVRVDAFGIAQFMKSQAPEVKMAAQVSVLDYRAKDDMVVELKTRAEGDRLVLAEVPPEPTLAATVLAVRKRVLEARPSELRDLEDLRVPVLDFEIVKDYPELCGKPLLTAREDLRGNPVAVAAQRIRFRLDEKGAVLISDGSIAGALPRRDFSFDQPFLILLERKGAKNPYFALWVANAELLVKPKKKAAGK
jgi:hypothetical protein